MTDNNDSNGLTQFNGLKGRWVREGVSSSNWNKGHWRNVTQTLVHYRNGQFFDPTTKREYAYQSTASQVTTAHWERFVEVHTVPTEAGIYTDKDDDTWILDGDGEWQVYLESNAGGRWVSGYSDIEKYVPFTLVRSLEKR